MDFSSSGSTSSNQNRLSSNYYYASQTRSDRMQSFASGVIPSLAKQAAAYEGYGAVASTNVAKSLSSSSAASTAGTVGTYAGMGMTFIAGAKGAYDIAKNWGKSTPAQGAMSGMAAGAAIGSVIPGVGTAIGAAVGTVVGGLIGFVKAGKHKDQVARDQVRSALQAAKIIDENYCIKLADGTTFDIGKDGGPKAELGGLRPYEVNFQNPLAGYAVSWMNPIISMLTGGNQKLTTDFVGYFANAALSNAKSLDDVRANVNSIMAQFKIDDQTLAAGIEDQTKQGIIDPGAAAAYMNGIVERNQIGVDLVSLNQLQGNVAQPHITKML